MSTHRRVRPSPGSRRRRPAPDPSLGLDADALRILAAAGLTLGEPLGGRRPGRPTPVRGLDRQDRAVSVHLLDLPRGPAGNRVLERLSALRRLRHPGIAPVHEVIALPGERAVVSVELVAGADLAVVLGARGCLGDQECATLLDAVGSALAHLAEQGLTHGDVAPGNVVVALDGHPVLIDLLGGVMETGTEGFAAPERLAGSPATPASDVYSLAALVRDCAGPGAGGEQLERILADALDPDPERRPSARDLAARAPEVGEVGTIELPDGAHLAAGALRAAAATPTREVPSRRRPGGSRRPETGRGRGGRRGGHRQDPGAVAPAHGGRSRPGRRYAVLAAVAVAGLALAATRGLWWPGQAGPEAVPQAPATASAEAGEPLSGVVVALCAARDAALVAGDAQALAATTVPGSPAAAADAGLLDALTQAGEQVGDLHTSVSQVQAVTVPPDAAATWPGAVAVRVTQAQDPSTRTSQDGTRTVPAQSARDVVLVLVPGPWRVADVRAADS